MTGHRRVVRAFAALLGGALLAASALPAAPAAATQRIIAGNSAQAGAWPWIARVEGRYSVNGTNFLSNCAGTVIAPHWIVTAAHCTYGGANPLPPSGMTVATGRPDLTQTAVGQTIAVDEIVRHPDYTNDQLHMDIALLHLAAATTAPPLEVATPDATYVSPLDVPNTAGWGWTQAGTPGSGSTTLNEAFMPLRANADCVAALTQFGNFEPSNMLCAGTSGVATTTCHGDSGGPLIVYADDGSARRPVLWGITSWGAPRCNDGVTAFSRITAFASFLAPAVAEPPLPPPPPPAPAAPVFAPAAPFAPASLPVPQLATASSVAGDSSAPRLSDLRLPQSVTVRDGRPVRAITVRLHASEAAALRITMQRGSGGASRELHGVYRAHVGPGEGRVTLPRALWRLRAGSYRLRIEATDAAGNARAVGASLRARRAR
jgi:hypothetical protein